MDRRSSLRGPEHRSRSWERTEHGRRDLDAAMASEALGGIGRTDPGRRADPIGAGRATNPRTGTSDGRGMARVVTRRSRRARDAAPAWIDARACVDRSIDRDPGSEPSTVAGISMLRWHRRRSGPPGGRSGAGRRDRGGAGRRDQAGAGGASPVSTPTSSTALRAADVRRRWRTAYSTRTMIVTTYGSIATNCGGTAVPWSRSVSAYMNPNSTLAARTPSGWDRPNITATSAMNPRPAVIPITNCVTSEIDSWAP